MRYVFSAAGTHETTRFDGGPCRLRSTRERDKVAVEQPASLSIPPVGAQAPKASLHRSQWGI